MLSVRVWGWACLAAAAALGTACFANGDDTGESAPQAASSRPSVLGAVVALEGGCTATKVGPKHLLVAARCVTNKPAFAIGKTVRFRKGNVDVEKNEAPVDAGGDVVTAASDASVDAAPDDATDGGAADASIDAAGGDKDGGAADAGGSDAGASDAIEEKIAEIKIHPTYLRKCGNGACARGTAGGAEIADVAIIVLAREIAGIPVAPIDLEPPSADAPILVVGNGCDEASVASPRLRAAQTKLAKLDAVKHEGSPYTAESAVALGGSYVVTTGALGICSDRDLGAPLFLADGTAIVGVSSNTTSTSATAPVPTTSLHARVDGFARHQVGGWLKEAGATTVRSCAGADCKPFPEANAPGPVADAAADAASADRPPFGESELGEEQPSEDSADEPSNDPPSAPAKKKAASTSSGCSTAGPVGSGSGFGWIALAVAAALASVRRRGVISARPASDSRA